MKKHIFLFLGFIGFTACATINWQGQNFDNYVAQYGVPTSFYKMQNGNTSYSYKRNCPDTTAQQELLIIVNSDNIIQQITATASCPNQYNNLSYNDPNYQYQQTIEQKEKQRKKRIEDIGYALKVKQLALPTAQSEVNIATTTLSIAKHGSEKTAGCTVTECETKLTEAKNRLEKLKKEISALEKEQLELMAYK